jgi:hypothetical protein
MEVAIHRAFLAGAVVAVLALLASLGVPSGKPVILPTSDAAATPSPSKG